MMNKLFLLYFDHATFTERSEKYEGARVGGGGQLPPVKN